MQCSGDITHYFRSLVKIVRLWMLCCRHPNEEIEPCDKNVPVFVLPSKLKPIWQIVFLALCTSKLTCPFPKIPCLPSVVLTKLFMLAPDLAWITGRHATVTFLVTLAALRACMVMSCWASRHKDTYGFRKCARACSRENNYVLQAWMKTCPRKSSRSFIDETL